MRTTKRISKLLDGATLRDKIKLLSENSSHRLSTGKDLYTENEIKAILDNITQSGEDEEYKKLITKINIIVNRRGELYFENARLCYFSTFAPFLYNTLQDYSYRLAVDNSLVTGFTGISKDSYGSEREAEIAKMLENLVNMYCSKMTDEDQDVDKKIYPYKVVRCKDGKLRLHADTIKDYLVSNGEEYARTILTVKTTYEAYKEYVRENNIEDLIPKDIDLIMGLLENDYIDSLRSRKSYSYWLSLVDHEPVDNLDPEGEYSIIEFFGVEAYYPLFSDVKPLSIGLGENNRFTLNLKDYE